MQYVKRSRITSLQMSMYLANVQRRNCSDPFPTQTARRSRKTKFPKEESSSHVVTKTNDLRVDNVHTKVLATSFSSSNVVDECFDVAQFESEISMQELLSDNVVDSVVVNAGNPGVVETEILAANRNHSSTADVLSSSIVPNVSHSTAVSSSSTPVSSVSTNAFDLSTIDTRLINVLQNLQNHGSVQIHFHFGESKK